MNADREKFNNKKYMAEYYRADMTWAEFRAAQAARGQMLADLSHGDDNAYVGKDKPSRAEVRQRRGKK